VQDTRITAENKGLHYRALDDLFFQAEQRQQEGQAEVTISVQILEVYNESLRDLLDPQATQGVRPVQPTLAVVLCLWAVRILFVTRIR
jgi:hypothetical protein